MSKSSNDSNSSGDTGGSSTNLGDTSTADSIVASARGSRDDFLFGDDRAIANPPNWSNQSSTELYNGAVNNNEPGMADELGQSWTNQGKDLQHAADTLYEAITELSGAWIGQAAGAAQGSLIGVANASSTAGDAALTMGKRMHDQAVAAAEVKKMPPPKEFNVDQALAAGLSGGPAAMAADMKAQHDAARAVQDEQERYMQAYTKAMSEVDSATPSFGPESIGMKPVTGTRYGSTGGSGMGGMVGVGDGGPGVSAIGTGLGAAAGGVAAGRGGLQGSGVGGSHGAGGAGGVADLANGTLNGPLTGTAQVTNAASSGPGAGAALGAAAVGAGLGLAGAKALGGRDGSRANKQQTEAELEAAAAEATDAADEAADGDGVGELPEVPQVQQAQAAQPRADHPGIDVGGPVPEVGSAAPQQYAQQPQFSAPQAPQSMSYGAPGASQPFAAQPAPLAEGATSGAASPAAAADPSATSSVAASDQHAGPSAGQPGSQQAAAQQQALAQQQAMAPPVSQYGGGSGAGSAAGAGAGGVGGMNVEADHAPASYLIQPDPDEIFGADEAVTSGVIGEDPEDD